MKIEYICKTSFTLDEYNPDCKYIGKSVLIPQNSKWEMYTDKPYGLMNEIHLERTDKKEHSWIEIDKTTLENHFVKLN